MRVQFVMEGDKFSDSGFDLRTPASASPAAFKVAAYLSFLASFELAIAEGEDFLIGQMNVLRVHGSTFPLHAEDAIGNERDIPKPNPETFRGSARSRGTSGPQPEGASNAGPDRAKRRRPREVEIVFP